MAVKFLTSEWAQGLQDTVNAHEGFRNAISNVDLALQFVVTDVPDQGDYHYYIAIADGSAAVAEGDLESPHATITNDYDTAEKISKGELNTQMAFMTGKLKVAGDMGKLMMNQAALGQFSSAASGLDVEY